MSLSMPVTSSRVCLNINIVCVVSALSPGEEVLQLLHSCNSFNIEELKKQESQLPQEDSEWKCTCASIFENVFILIKNDGFQGLYDFARK